MCSHRFRSALYEVRKLKIRCLPINATTVVYYCRAVRSRVLFFLVAGSTILLVTGTVVPIAPYRAVPACPGFHLQCLASGTRNLGFPDVVQGHLLLFAAACEALTCSSVRRQS